MTNAPSDAQAGLAGPTISTSAGVHLVLQGKGGVGKSLVASLLSQYFRTKGMPCRSIDTDPVNQTLSQYKALDAQHLRLLNDGRINTAVFDELMEDLFTQPETFIVDSGASTFVPLWRYLLENDVVTLLQDHGRTVYLHSVVTGGQALMDTLSGFADIAEKTPASNLVAWVNEFFGPVVHNGKEFTELAVVRNHLDRIRGVVRIERRTPDTFGRDMDELLRRKLTFEEAQTGGGFSIMSRQRLQMIRRDIFDQLDKLRLDATDPD
jgi:hypothetical protein